MLCGNLTIPEGNGDDNQIAEIKRCRVVGYRFEREEDQKQGCQDPKKTKHGFSGEEHCSYECINSRKGKGDNQVLCGLECRVRGFTRKNQRVDNAIHSERDLKGHIDDHDDARGKNHASN